MLSDGAAADDRKLLRDDSVDDVVSTKVIGKPADDNPALQDQDIHTEPRHSGRLPKNLVADVCELIKNHELENQQHATIV